MNRMLNRSLTPLIAILFTTLLVACSSANHVRAPVVDLSLSKRVALGSENAGKPGYYTVRQGDTLVRIALEYGQSPKDLARWNNLSNPNLIEVGQVLRVALPVATSNKVAAIKDTPMQTVEVTPISNASASVKGAPLAEPGAKNLDSTKESVVAPTAASEAATSQTGTTKPEAKVVASNITWAWPTNTAVSEKFNNDSNKGLNFAGKMDTPIYAAADGQVVYVGSGLRGYGNLVIIKHNDQFVTAYAHNQTILVKEDQTVKRGQQIATMGNSDSPIPQLHFELRKDGKPVDPEAYLPSR